MSTNSGPHPACTCTEGTFTAGPDWQTCRTRAHPLDPHPVLTADQLTAAVAQLRIKHQGPR